MKVLLDNGHGGVINGEYQTAGKRSPKWKPFGVLYEGVFNRWVVNRVAEALSRVSIPYEIVCPELEDISLKERTRRINNFYKEDNKVWLLSIHANAGGGEGIEIFTTKGETTSDGIAESVICNLSVDIPNQKYRYDYTDGDKDKEENFYILRNTKPPAVLLECGFMDNKKDYLKLIDETYLQQLVKSIVRTVIQYYEG